MALKEILIRLLAKLIGRIYCQAYEKRVTAKVIMLQKIKQGQNNCLSYEHLNCPYELCKKETGDRTGFGKMV